MAETAKLYLDQDVWVGLAVALRQAGFDAVATKEANRKGASDADQLIRKLASRVSTPGPTAAWEPPLPRFSDRL